MFVSQELMEFTRVALNLTKYYISSRTNALVIMEKCSGWFCQEQNHSFLLEYFLRNLSCDISVQLEFGKPNVSPWDFNLFVIDSAKAFEALRLQLPGPSKNRQFYFLILLTCSTADPFYVHQQMYKIFKVCLQIGVKNSVIMHRYSGERHISFYTYYAFGRYHCWGDITIREVNRYVEGSLREDYLFPKQLRNYHGCTIMVSAHLVEPLLSFNGDFTNEEHLSQKSRIGGIEGDILKVVADTLNMNLKFRFPRNLNKNYMYSNRTDSLTDLAENLSEIAIGGLSPILKETINFTYSSVYHTTPGVFVVKRGLSFGPIRQLLKPLDNNIWILIIIQWLVAIVLIQLVQRCGTVALWNFIFGPHNRQPLRNMFMAILGYPIPSAAVPKRNFARFLLMAWLLLTFELRNAYQGKMYDSLRLAKHLPVPRTIDDLIRHNYIFLSPEYNDFYPRNKTRVMSNAFKRLHEINSSREKLTAMALLDYLVDFIAKNIHNTSLTYVEEDIYSFQCVMMFRKYSVLPQSINPKLKLLTDAGITDHIAKRYVRWQKQSGNQRGGGVPPTGIQEITNHKLRGVYNVLYCSDPADIHGVKHNYSRSLILGNIEDSQASLMHYGQVALYMVTQYISPRTNTLIIMENCLSHCDKHRLYHSTVLKFFLNNLNYSMATQLFLGQPDERPWDYNMFVVPTWREFELSNPAAEHPENDL
ncbi:uncharacterized protein LOC133334569 [Musca vetustissima]|uniref:uncharacterized protein LOC133334569 n=1 Tax=Musca vetustissima TaxID=27455 RepID=UPI002AB71A67|nr:uncharacterized protein LOC133334569 [Musca vetustissima]